MNEVQWHLNYDKDILSDLISPEKNIYQLFREYAIQHPKKKAFVSLGFQFTYSQLLDYAERFASLLISNKVKKGDRICFLLPNLVHFPIVHLGILKAGAISVPVNPLYTKFEIEKTIKLCSPVMIVTLNEFYQKVEGFDKTTSVKKIITANNFDFLPGYVRLILGALNRKKYHFAANHDKLFRGMKRVIPGNDPVSDINPNDTAVLLPTGGITGSFKLAELTHRNLIFNTLQITEWTRNLYSPKDSILAGLPFFHSFGITLCLHLGLLSGIRIVALPRFSVEKAINAVRKYAVTYFPGVPAMFAAVAEYKKLDTSSLKSLKLGLSGGVELHCQIKEKFENSTGIKLIECYGLTEASPAVLCNPLEGKNIAGSVGIPLPSTECKVVNPDSGQICMENEEGELLIKGPQVMKGYWNNEEETRLILKNGWLFSGDKAIYDQSGYFYLTGRYKKLFIYSGFNVFQAELENVLLSNPKIESVIVYAEKNCRYGDLIKADVKLKNGAIAKEKELKDYCRLFLTGYKIPKHIFIKE